MRKSTAFILPAVTLVIALACSKQAYANGDAQTLAWNMYYGTVTTLTDTYDVKIDESDKGHGFSRIVHIVPVGQPDYVGITGHDYNGDGEWDAIFYCGRPNAMVDSTNSGCNSVEYIKNTWHFEPSPGDSGKAKPFSRKAIAFAILELDAAMTATHNNENVVSMWVWDSASKSGKYIYERSNN